MNYFICPNTKDTITIVMDKGDCQNILPQLKREVEPDTMSMFHLVKYIEIGVAELAGPAPLEPVENIGNIRLAPPDFDDEDFPPEWEDEEDR